MDGEKVQILMVDDTLAEYEMVQNYLQKKGWEVSWAPDNEQALEMISKNSYDLIILDLLMPSESGDRLLERLRQHPPDRIPPIIIYSDFPEDLISGVSGIGKANDYLTKQSGLEKLLSSIEVQLKIAA